MKKKLMGVLIAVFVLMSSLGAKDFAKKGVWELGGSVSFTTTTTVFNGETSEHSLNNFTLDVPVSYFLADGFELGLVPSLISASYGGDSLTALGIYLAPAWNFNFKSNVFPYVEGRIGYNSINHDEGKGLAWAILGGVKVKVGGNVLIKTGLGYLQRTLEEEGHRGGRNGDNTFFIQAGFSIFLGK